MSNSKPKKHKTPKIRDLWIPESWRYPGGGAHKNKKKYDRKRDKKERERNYE